jgi:hypothetical protein
VCELVQQFVCFHICMERLTLDCRSTSCRSCSKGRASTPRSRATRRLQLAARFVMRYICEQGSKAVLVSRLLAATPAPAPAPAPAAAPAVPAAAPAAAPAPAPAAPSVTVTASSPAANDEAARLQRRMEKFGVPASAPAAAASDAEAEKIKKRGMPVTGQRLYRSRSLALGSTSFPPDSSILFCCRSKVRHWCWQRCPFQGRRRRRGAKKGAFASGSHVASCFNVLACRRARRSSRPKLPPRPPPKKPPGYVFPVPPASC